MPYTPTSPEDRAELLAALGLSSTEELFQQIPDALRLKDPLDLPPGLSELELRRELEELAAENQAAGSALSFLGGGSYDHFIPSAVPALASRGEFSTSYTPYQPEVSQGTLQVIFEFQSLICALSGMEVANASIYDGATSMAEGAIMLAGASRGTPRILLPESVHPHWREVVRTHLAALEVEVVTLPTPAGRLAPEVLERALEGGGATLCLQHPNFFGCLEDVEALSTLVRDKGGRLLVAADPVSLGILRPPAAYGADVYVGEGQPLGLSTSYGGPYLGLFACGMDFLRRMPGRVVGATVDSRGQRAYCMTLQTREQHIRREKATSNICTNQALCALTATVYLSLMGREGLRQAAELSLRKARYAADAITSLKGLSLAFEGHFFREFVVQTPVPATQIVEELASEGIFPGLDLSRFLPDSENHLLVCVTEKRTKPEIDRLVAALGRYA
ncbi:MAG TPA: aminomethyl-transferring glycine dehydrogenase subunit GcvPA [Armatimonadota bacterium]